MRYGRGSYVRVEPWFRPISTTPGTAMFLYMDCLPIPMDRLTSDIVRVAMICLFLLLLGCDTGQPSELPADLPDCCRAAFSVSEDGHYLLRTEAVLRGSCPSLNDCIKELGIDNLQVLKDLSEVITEEQREESIRVRASQPCVSSPGNPSAFCPSYETIETRENHTLIDS